MNKRLCMVVFSYYPADPRPRREAEALVDAGWSVDMLCLRNLHESPTETVRGVQIYRLPLQKQRGGKLRYLWEYFYFGLLAFFKLTRLHISHPYRIVHVHNMPDILVFTALIPRLFGAKIVLDLHDPMPEVFIAKYEMAASHPVIRILRLFEKLSIAFAHRVLTPNLAFQALFVARSCPPEKIQVLMNAPDERIFTPRTPSAVVNPDQFVIMYHGTIVERNGLDTALYAIAQLTAKIPGLVFLVFGEGDFVPRFLEIKAELNLQDTVRYHGHTPIEQIAATLETIDLGIIPNKRSPFTEINMPTRIFECLRMGKPVIAPRTQGILDYFAEDALFFFEPGDADDLARVILAAYQDPIRRAQVLQRGSLICEQHGWALEKQGLLNLANTLAAA